jgi:hypothetical protein
VSEGTQNLQSAQNFFARPLSGLKGRIQSDSGRQQSLTEQLYQALDESPRG